MAEVKGLRKVWQARKQLQGTLEGCAFSLISLQLLLILNLGFLSYGKIKPSFRT